jgi:hypothetical protein
MRSWSSSRSRSVNCRSSARCASVEAVLQCCDLRRQIGDGLFCPAIRCLDGPRAQVFEFRA